MPYEFDLTPLINILAQQPQFQGGTTKYPPMSPNSEPGGAGLLNTTPGRKPVPGLPPPNLVPKGGSL